MIATSIKSSSHPPGRQFAAAILDRLPCHGDGCRQPARPSRPDGFDLVTEEDACHDHLRRTATSFVLDPTSEL